MPEIDRWSECLSEEMRAVWPTLAAPSHVDGLAVASLADLLASKLDVIMYRPKLRDYVDLAAIDRAGPYRLEDGLLFHTRRYGSPLAATDLARIVALLEDPGPLQTDRTFDAVAAPTLEYLRGRVPALQRHLQSLRAASPAPPVERSTGRAPVGPISSPDDLPPCAPGPSGPDV